VEYIKFVARTK